MKRAVDIGAVDAAAIKTAGGKVRLRLLFTVEQLEALLTAARNGDLGDDDVKRNVTHGNAPDSEKKRSEDDDDGDTRAKPQRVFVREGTPAWDAWVTEKRRTTGNSEWRLTVQHTEGGKTITGWWFPTLFPPERPATTGPPTSPTLTAEDEAELEKLK